MKAYAFLISLICAFSHGQEYLEPEASVFSDDANYDYHRMVVDGFREVFEQNVHARVVALPSLTTEYAIGLKEDRGTFRVLRLAPEMSYWGYYYAREYGADRTSSSGLSQSEPGVAVKTCEREIPSDLALSILKVWESMLLETRYKKSERLGRDGETYHFSGHFDFQLLAGKTWSPKPETQPGKLVGIALAMNVWCQRGTPSDLESLGLAVAALARDDN
ncbi:MAG: hypothetical protein V4751_13830 [Pseudomonadota bacterium]